MDTGRDRWTETKGLYNCCVWLMLVLMLECMYRSEETDIGAADHDFILTTNPLVMTLCDTSGIEKNTTLKTSP